MFRERKAAAIASFFIDKSGLDGINDIDLMKLAVFAERLNLSQNTALMTGDEFVNMPFGPVLTRMYDCMKQQDSSCRIWAEHFEPMTDYWIKRKSPVDVGAVLSEWEVEILETIWAEHGESLKWDKVRYAHSAQVPEWRRPEPPARVESLDFARIFNVGLGDDIETATTKANLLLNVEGARRRFS